MHLFIILLPLSAGLERFPRQEEEYNKVMVKNISKETQEEILDIINGYRRNVQPTASNMLRMFWSDEAAKNAEHWSGTCIGHSTAVKKVVSGLYCFESTHFSQYHQSWRQVILSWYYNFTDYHYNYGELYPKKYVSSHNQLLSYNTYQVGCAEAFCPSNREPFFYICRFCPATYAVKDMPYNAGPPCADCPRHCLDNLCTNPCMYVDLVSNCKLLKVLFHCNEDTMVQMCQATCNCETEII